MPSQFASHYARHLPEVGDPILTQAAKIEQGRSDAERALAEAIAEHKSALAHFQKEEARLAASIAEQWTPAEIVAAMEKA